DEPLSNLDAKLREETRAEIRELVKRLDITTVYVTHDQLEALTMSDVVAVMDQGEIVQEASPMVIYREPKVRFVADFIGLTNFIEGSVRRAANGNALGEVETASGLITCILPDKAALGDKVLIVIRPEDLNLVPGPASAGTGNVIEGRVSTSLFMGDSTEFRVSIKGTALRLKLHPSTAVAKGDTVRIELPPERCRALMG
ncbi:MAG: ABC transporter ATP-binding protein, partial [Gammaproteobacteria bacterium]